MITVVVLPELAVLLAGALRLLRERGWQGWGFEDQGVLSIDGALLTAAGATVAGLEIVAVDERALALVKAASQMVVTTNRLPVDPDCLWEWEYDDATQGQAIRLVEVTYAVYVAGTRQPVALANPCGGRPVLRGRARAYRAGDHTVEVDCGPHGTVWAAVDQVLLDDGRWPR